VAEDTAKLVSTEAFIHPHALVDPGAEIGARTRVWAFAHVVKGAKVGEDCNICDHTFIEGKVVVGDRVTVKCGVFLWDGVVVEDDVFLGPGAALTNDPRPRSKQYPSEFPRTLLRQGCSIGANSVILPGLTIGCWAMIGAGSVVTRDVPDYALLAGNPARLRGWACRCGRKLQLTSATPTRCFCGRSLVLRNGLAVEEKDDPPSGKERGRNLERE
jgi:acetyltransferase-like isoleucine patch superfamily enzyme